MNFTKIKETCLYVSNLDKTKEFYNRKLGLEIIGEVVGRHVFFRAGASVLLCFNPDASKIGNTLPPHFGQGQMHFAFEVTKNKYNTIKSEIQSVGIDIEYEHNWGDGFLSFYFRDPDNHLLEVVMEGMWER